MENDNSIKIAFEYLRIALRYVASGFIAVIVIMLIDQAFARYVENQFAKTPWIVVFIAGPVGIFIYAVHHAYFDKLFYNFSVWLYKRYYQLPLIIAKSSEKWNKLSGLRSRKCISGWVRSNRRVLIFLKEQSYMRKTSNNPIIVKLQNNLEDKLALLVFLYDSIYSMIFVPAFYFTIDNFPALNPFTSNHIINATAYYWIAILGVMSLLCALGFDYRITRREMWLVENYPTPVPFQDVKEFEISTDSFPDAKQVYVAGSFNGWNLVKLKLSENKLWTTTVKCNSGMIEYKLFVDGKWKTDPSALVFRDASGHDNSICYVE